MLSRVKALFKELRSWNSYWPLRCSGTRILLSYLQGLHRSSSAYDCAIKPAGEEKQADIPRRVYFLVPAPGSKPCCGICLSASTCFGLDCQRDTWDGGQHTTSAVNGLVPPSAMASFRLFPSLTLGLSSSTTAGFSGLWAEHWASLTPSSP